MTITEFLTARYDEEEGTSAPLSDGSEWRDMPIWSDLEVAGGDRTVSAEERAETMRVHEHWTARVLADIAAKRAIVALNQTVPMRLEDDRDEGRNDMLWDVLCLLAQPYAEHPDFDPAWRVT